MITRDDFDDVLGFVENGGYALQAYDRYRKLFIDSDGLVHVRSERIARMARMNLGTIVEAPLLKVRYSGRGRAQFGEIEESFVNMMPPGATFMFAGRLLKFVRIRETTVEVQDGGDGEPMVPAYAGARQPLTTNLATRVRTMLHDHTSWHHFPDSVREWLTLQLERSELPGEDDLLVETFPRNGRWYLVAYCFEGRNAHQTLGMLLTRRMERAGYAPLGFVATDYVISAWCAHEPTDVAPLFQEDMLGDDLEAWMAESSMLRRTFATSPSFRGWWSVICRVPKRRASGDRQHRPDLRRAAAASAGSCVAAGDAGGRRVGADRCRPGRGNAVAHCGPGASCGARPGLAVGGAGAAGYRGASRCGRRGARTICWPRPKRWWPRRPA